jgi:hypothetical protein
MQAPDDDRFDPYEGDELLRAVVERALAPYAGRLSPEDLEALRDYLIVFNTTHPAAEPLVARLRKRPEVVRSTLVNNLRQRDATAPLAASAPAAAPRAPARKGRRG